MLWEGLALAFSGARVAQPDGDVLLNLPDIKLLGDGDPNHKIETAGSPLEELVVDRLQEGRLPYSSQAVDPDDWRFIVFQEAADLRQRLLRVHDGG
ncbi:unnamed protein product [Spirodela intermedia]|uniref:Uncharacterized protein n=1 Tax=Spirodela intermedia TaxID=51605 RepID=A0A7I8JQL7_SPIIN|nr:unnamed protein product [Spirodela intermedia]CAA6672454.1 unnamed protein product [Spirodela intermedia]CAA6674423.1 unnamed protein product [Spirodela intermedia]